MINKPIFYAAGVFALLVVLLSIGLYKQIQRNGELAIVIEGKDKQIAAKNGVINRERENAQDAANRSLAARLEETKRETELNKLRKCVANKSCGIELRFESCSGSGLPGTDTGGSESISAASESKGELREWFFDHSGLIDRYELRIKELQDDVRARSSPDYCKRK